ncbi:hypothetical protein [Candidatus Venteria ishoeyi]|uniref:Uncharacterized protein n=1 Tax=Candidatus Venteria ishoeyi TaxID=1899563 RepID=A0A1H6F207_9GAMM|nr:hypothetical protein [Candidatus Venteria ishoeyi]SEH04160.1 Uncharacterised protein [Candidatus Venteria ishoeyi]
MKKRDKWVIDADIAHSSGTTEHPISRSCRLFLDFVRKQGYFIVMNKELMNEWNQHKSIYAKKWLVSMYARKKIIRHNDGKFDFEQKIASSSLRNKQKNAALKDIHLLNASRSYGKTIASGDDAAREIYVILAASHKEIAEFLWVNPKNISETLIDYIENSKSAKPEWYLDR